MSHDDGPRPRVWTVKASTEQDAIQIAFALDGGWTFNERDASGMLDLALAYCQITKIRPSTQDTGSRIYSKKEQQRMARKNQDIVFDQAGRLVANSTGH